MSIHDFCGVTLFILSNNVFFNMNGHVTWNNSPNAKPFEWELELTLFLQFQLINKPLHLWQLWKTNYPLISTCQKSELNEIDKINIDLQNSLFWLYMPYVSHVDAHKLPEYDLFIWSQSFDWFASLWDWWFYMGTNWPVIERLDEMDHIGLIPHNETVTLHFIPGSYVILLSQTWQCICFEPPELAF